MNLLDLCEKYFGTRDLYKVLGSSKKATNAKLHKAYRELSLKVHPDHRDGSIQATQKFQVLAKVHDFLTCEASRKIYDDTGNVGTPLEMIVTDQDFQNCKSLYEGSEAERQDIRTAYMNCHGSLDAIMVNVPFLCSSDRSRVAVIINELLANDFVPKLEPVKKEKKRSAKQANLETFVVKESKRMRQQ